MVSKSIDIHPAELAPFDPSSRRLIIELAPNALSAVLWDKIHSKVVAAEVFSGDISKAGDRQTITEQSQLLLFKDVETIAYSAFYPVLPIPAYLYSPERAQEQLNLLYSSRTNNYTGGDIIKEQSMVLSWQMPATVHQFLVNRFKVLQVKHLLSNVIVRSSNHSKTIGELVVHGNLVWLVVWKNGKLIVAKSIEVEHPDDLSFQLLQVCKQFDIETADIDWKISGMIQQDSLLWAAVTRYFSNVSEMESAVVLSDEIPGYYLAYLF
jgi:hypothetical protein